MRNKLKNAFDAIRAEEQLKRNTEDFLWNNMHARKKRMVQRFAVAFASFAAVAIACLFSYNIYFDEAAYMDIDVNPSIELTLNRFDRVIDAHAYNEDGEKVLSEVSIKSKSYRKALEELIGKMREMGYIKDSGLFTATIQKKKGEVNDEELDALKAYVDSALREKNRIVESDIFAVDSTTKSHSHNQNLTPAKYLAILKLQKYDSSVTFDSCRDHTIAEIEEQAHSHAAEGEAAGDAKVDGKGESDGGKSHSSHDEHV